MNSEVLTRIIRAIRTTARAAEALSVLTGGNTITIVEDAHGDLVDAVYAFVGEQTNELQESVTYKLIHSSMSDAEVANTLLATTVN